ncbi:MAG: hypothetical protein AABX47_04460 [Nanoarchaeota archaeon]
MRPEIIKETPVSLPEAKGDLERIKRRDGELTFRGTKTEEYLAQFAAVDEKKAKDLYKKIEALDIPRLKEAHICKMIDVMPTNINDLKSILQGQPVTIKDENLKKILDVLSGK